MSLTATSPRPAERIILGLALLAGAVALLANLGAGSLLASDDVIYAQMAREMAAEGRWLDATWMGVVLFEKPPLLFWLLRVSGEVFGWTDGSMRLPGALAGVVGLGYAMALARRATPRAPTSAALCALLLTVATTTWVMTIRRPLTDPLLAAAALAVVYHAATHGRGVALGIAGGLGVLAKWVAIGPVALAALVALALGRRWSQLGVGALVGVAVAAPWHVAMTVRHGAAFWEVYLGYHVTERVGSALVGAPDASYYLTTALELDPLLTPVLLAGGLLAIWTWWTTRADAAPDAPLGLVLGAAGLTLVAIHLAGTKLFHYLLPVVPLAAVATVAALGPWLPRRLIAGALVVLAGVGFVTGPLDPHVLAPDYSRWSKAVATQHLRDLPPSSRAIVWEAYDPAVTWYADRPVRMWTSDERFFAIQQSIDMMRRSEAVVWASDAAMGELVSGGPDVVIVLPRPEAAATLAPWLRRVALQRQVVLLEGTAAAPRVIKLGEAR